MTKLEAVNMMLRKIGEMPVNTLVDAGYSEVSIALEILEQTNRDVQANGLSFNTDIEFDLVPDGNNFVYVPSNMLKLLNVYDFDITVRGDGAGNKRLYNKVDHTYEFTSNVTVDLTLELDFEDVEFIYQHYIALKAALIFANEKNVDEGEARLISIELVDAEEKMIQYEMDNQNISVWDDPELNKVNNKF